VIPTTSTSPSVTSEPTKPSANGGAIGGGVAGGIVGAGLVGGLLFWFVIRKRSKGKETDEESYVSDEEDYNTGGGDGGIFATGNPAGHTGGHNNNNNNGDNDSASSISLEDRANKFEVDHEATENDRLHPH
jgi:hypothetical protein